MKREIVSIIFLFTFINKIYSNDSDLRLCIDSIYNDDTLQMGNVKKISIRWSICNNSRNTIDNFSSPWFLYPENVVIDSMEFLKKKNIAKENRMSESVAFGMGNLKIAAVSNGDTVLPFVDFFIEIPSETINKITINANRCIDGIIKTKFDFGIEKKSKWYFILYYNSKYQNSGNEQIWRGKLISNPYYYMLDYNK